MRQPAGSFFNHYAHDFEAIYEGDRGLARRLLNRWLRRSMFLRYRRCLELCEPATGKRILDVGCGPGHYAVALSRMGASVVGVDAAAAMVDAARNRARRAGVEKQCHFICQPFEAFQSSERFDHAICMGFLEYIPDPGATVDRVMSLVTQSGFFSLPARGGPLAWQRALRYRWKTALYMYSGDAVTALFENCRSVSSHRLERLQRDYFVSARPQDSV